MYKEMLHHNIVTQSNYHLSETPQQTKETRSIKAMPFDSIDQLYQTVVGMPRTWPISVPMYTYHPPFQTSSHNMSKTLMTLLTKSETCTYTLLIALHINDVYTYNDVYI